MSKIWEVNFTNFSGVSDVAYDEIGTQHLTTSSGVVKVSPLPNLSFRPGVAFTNDSVHQAFGARSAGAVNACFNESFSQRSWVMWVYLAGALSNATYFDSGAHSFWGEWSSTTWLAGIGKGTTGLPRCVPSSGQSIEGSTTLQAGWHLFIHTCDKIMLETNFYIDNVFIGSSTFVTSNTAGTSDCYIGERDATREGTYQIGLCSVYDHILTANERQALYDTFLKDSAIGSTPYQSFSGTLFGLDGFEVPGAVHYSIYQPTSAVVHSGVTSSSGTYEVDLPYSGSYTVVFTNTPSGGSRAFPVIAVSGGVYYP